MNAGFSGVDKSPSQLPVPHGPLLRAVLIHIQTYAIRNKTSVISLGETPAAFLRTIGLSTEGKRYRVLQEQLDALLTAEVSIGSSGKTITGLINPVAETCTSKWPSEIILFQAFYESLRERAVPLDLRAIQALRGSALALDIYLWAAHRLWRVPRRTHIPWPALYRQFGGEYEGANKRRNFRDEFRLKLAQVRTVYPTALINSVAGGVLIDRSPPPVSPNKSPVFEGFSQGLSMQRRDFALPTDGILPPLFLGTTDGRSRVKQQGKLSPRIERR